MVKCLLPGVVATDLGYCCESQLVTPLDAIVVDAPLLLSPGWEAVGAGEQRERDSEESLAN